MGVIVIRGGKITSSIASESEDTYAEFENHFTIECPYGTSAKSEGKATQLLRNKLTAFYSEVQTALTGFDWNQ